MIFSCRHLKAAVLCLGVILTACTANLETLKKEADGNRLLGETYMGQGNYTAALRYLLLAESQYPDDPKLQNALGLTYMEKKRLDLAVGHFEKALVLDPKFSEAKNNMGAAYLRMRNWEAAIAIFQELTQDLLYMTPQFPLFNLGWAYYNLKDYQRSETYYLQALEISPNFIKALYGLGMAYIADGKGPEAVAAIEKAIALSPPTAQLYFVLAKAHEIAGNRVEALNAYRKVVELEPESPLAHEAKNAADRTGK